MFIHSFVYYSILVLESNDFISKILDEVLFIIFSIFPIKDVLVGRCLSRRWMFLWCNLIRLRCNGSETFNKKTKNQKRSKYLKQVNSLVQSHNSLMVQEFTIHFDLDYSYEKNDYWLHFAVNKKVEILESNLMCNSHKMYQPSKNYGLPLLLTNKRIVTIFSRETIKPTIMELWYFNELMFKILNIRETIVHVFLRNSHGLTHVAG